MHVRYRPFGVVAALLVALVIGHADLFAGNAHVHEADVLAIFARTIRPIDDTPIGLVQKLIDEAQGGT